MELNKKKEDKSNEDMIDKLNSNIKSLTLEEQFEKWLIVLKEHLSKKEYKKTIENINRLSKKYIHIESFWKVIILKIKSFLKIIENKMKKYNFNQTDSNIIKMEKEHIKKYSKMTKKNFVDLTNEIKINNQLIKNTSLIQSIIELYLEYIYILCIFSKQCDSNIDLISLISLTIVFGEKTYNIILHHKSLNHLVKIYLLGCKFYIENKDHEICIDLLEKCIELSLRELFYLIDFHESINESNFVGKFKKKLKKIFINFIIIFLYRGICYENLGFIQKAVESYRQCRWFTKKFFQEQINLVFLINKICERANSYYSLLHFLKIALNKKNVIYSKNEKNQKVNINYSLDETKFKSTLKILNNINIPEINSPNQFSNSINAGSKEYYLSNVKLLEAYMSEKFKNIIKNMDKINLYDFDDETRKKIQKTLNKKYFEDKFKTYREKNKNSFLIEMNKKRDRINSPHSKDNNNINLNNTSRISSANIKNEYKLKIKKNETVSKNNSLNVSNITHPFSFQHSNQNNKSLSKSFTRLHSNKKKLLEESKLYRSSSAFFGKKYQKKINYIKKLDEREIKFQKELLSLKKSPLFDMEIYNKFLISKDTERKFSKMQILSSLQPLFYFNEYYILQEYTKQKRSLKNTVIKSQSNKAVIRYKKQKHEINKNFSKSKSLENYNKEEILAQNKKVILLISKKIENINLNKSKKSKEFEKQVNSFLNMKKSQSFRKTINHNNNFSLIKNKKTNDLKSFLHFNKSNDEL